MTSLVRRIRNDFESYEAFSREMLEFLETHHIAAEPAFTITLAIEELVVNVIRHGFETSGQHEILVRLEKRDSDLLLTIEDDGRPFDPTAAPDPAFEEKIEDRPVGGLGIYLVRESVSELSYQRNENWNQTTVRVSLNQPSAD